MPCHFIGNNSTPDQHTLGLDRNDAAAGRHPMSDGVTEITIEYFDFAKCKARFNVGVKRTDKAFRKVGWFWTCYKGRSTSIVATWHGPFSASSAALRDAKEQFAEQECGVE